jgi:hypothetical protein
MGECFHDPEGIHGVHFLMKLSFRSPLFEYPLNYSSFFLK